MFVKFIADVCHTFYTLYINWKSNKTEKQIQCATQFRCVVLRTEVLCWSEFGLNAFDLNKNAYGFIFRTKLIEKMKNHKS